MSNEKDIEGNGVWVNHVIIVIFVVVVVNVIVVRPKCKQTKSLIIMRQKFIGPGIYHVTIVIFVCIDVIKIYLCSFCPWKNKMLSQVYSIYYWWVL